ncbi:type III pantothenate kinase [Flavobacterium sp. I3-2]|uniref:type III pantothenate kinase n=1 Tax=Flavobacterium sp. I3-2 TaxID=2748319 RepID=UPI0015B0751B|nr:type III pantothenate kinase [Flavobacterium sp. I3-2]
MNLAIDIGNTRTKVAVYENNIILNIEIFEQIYFRKKIQNLISNCSEKPNIILTTVKNFSQDDEKWLSEISALTIINSKTPLPFVNKYSTPETLGIDRRVLASGAVLKFPNQNRLIIDAGTCITYDFITAKNEYLGGAISPGINLKYKSLNDYTDKLPLLSLNETHDVIGNSTNNSIHSGIINATLLEVDGFINSYINDFQNLTVILTGGDADFLAKRLKNTIFANPNFLLESLIMLYQYTIDHDK